MCSICSNGEQKLHLVSTRMVTFYEFLLSFLVDVLHLFLMFMFPPSDSASRKTFMVWSHTDLFGTFSTPLRQMSNKLQKLAVFAVCIALNLNSREHLQMHCTAKRYQHGQHLTQNIIRGEAIIFPFILAALYFEQSPPLPPHSIHLVTTSLEGNLLEPL